MKSILAMFRERDDLIAALAVGLCRILNAPSYELSRKYARKLIGRIEKWESSEKKNKQRTTT